MDLKNSFESYICSQTILLYVFLQTDGRAIGMKVEACEKHCTTPSSSLHRQIPGEHVMHNLDLWRINPPGAKNMLV